MNLLQVRTKFIDLTGRFDLVVDTTSYVDNGADFFIQAGQRYLDISQPIDKTMMRLQKDIAIGTHILNIQNLRFVKEVWLVNSDGEKSKLEKKDHAWIRNQYPDAIANITQDTPLYWCPIIIALAPEQKALKATDYTGEFTYDYEDIMFADEGSHWSYDGILVMPPTDEAIQVEVWGAFWSSLSSDTDKSVWSVRYPELSVLAAIYSLEKFYRNTAGVRDAMVSMQDILRGIDYDMVDAEITDVSGMDG